MRHSTAILLIEDNHDEVWDIRRALRQAGLEFPLVVLSDADYVTAYLEGSGPYADRIEFPPPGLILLNLSLTRVSALDILAALHRHPEGKRPPVIVLSSPADDGKVERARALGANAIILRSTGYQDLVALLKETILLDRGTSHD